MAVARAARGLKVNANVQTIEPPVPVVARERAPEVEAVIATMDPGRRAKLESIQARNLARLAQTKEGREALERLEERHHPVDASIALAKAFVGEKAAQTQTVAASPEPEVTILPPVREPVWVPLKAPFRITGSQSGMCVSEMGPCQCGAAKLQWHPICIKVRANV
jgi:hypothetical protein